jgi:hypothetical protein
VTSRNSTEGTVTISNIDRHAVSGETSEAMIYGRTVCTIGTTSARHGYGSAALAKVSDV